eukprot:5484912-Amphidinium_carterae.2
MKVKIRSSFDPCTAHDCLFMCMSREFGRVKGLELSPGYLRKLVHDLWQADQTVLGLNASIWASVLKLSTDQFLESTLHTRLGTAPDAVLLARLFG